jgi:hypothetical protein
MRNNRKPVDKIQQLLQDGLAKDQTKIAYYRVVIEDPRMGFNNTIYRQYAADVFNTMINYILNDPVMYNRFRQDLIQDNRNYEEVVTTRPDTVRILKELGR